MSREAADLDSESADQPAPDTGSPEALGRWSGTDVDGRTMVKAGLSKTRTGCIGCRLRRKKCDERRPTCSGCQRNVLVCTWVEDVPDGAAQKLLTRKTRKENSHSVRSASFSTSTPARTPGEGLDCPVSQSWTSNPLEISIDQYVSATLHLQALFQFQHNLLRNPKSRILFDHYLHRTNKTVARCCGETNTFIMQLLPITMSHDLVFHSLLALSGFHFHYTSGTPVGETTLIHYGQAIQAQKFGITFLLSGGNEDTVVPLLITSLILCIVESTRGDAGDVAIRHLKGARSLLQSALRLPESQLDQETRAFLIERYAYTIVLANISMGEESDSWVLHDVAQLFPLMKSSYTGTLGSGTIGCVHELCRLIPTVSSLAMKRQKEESLGIESWETISTFLSLYTTIKKWESVCTDEFYTLCGKIYQHTLLVYLASSFERYEQQANNDVFYGSEYSPLVGLAFSNFIPLLDSVPVDSPMSSTLCWPLVVFGSCAKLAEHRELVRARLLAMSSVIGMGNARETCSLLDILWSSGDYSQANPLSIEPIMKKEKMTVMFL
ncbi:hypothetical protein B7463_g9004, partial [Scytalidium lignicola]